MIKEMVEKIPKLGKCAIPVVLFVIRLFVTLIRK